MPSSNFSDYNTNTPITAAWLSGINNFAFSGVTSPAAWVRFDGTSGHIVQSYGIAGVTRTATGIYTVTFAQTLPNAANCYQVTTNIIGMNAVTTETTNSIVVETANSSGVLADSTAVSVLVFGTYVPNF